MKPWHALLAGMTLQEMERADRALWHKTFEFSAGVTREEVDARFDERIDYLRSVEVIRARPESEDAGQ